MGVADVASQLGASSQSSDESQGSSLEEVSSGGSSVASSSSVFSYTEYASLDCVACACSCCGTEFLSVVSPRGEHPLVLTGDLCGARWFLTGASVPMVTLSFRGMKDLVRCLRAVNATVRERVTVWWSNQCWAGRPHSSPDSLSKDIGFCSVLILVNVPGGMEGGLWSDYDIVRDVGKMLGCIDGETFVAKYGTESGNPVIELVPLDQVQTWLNARSDLLGRAPSRVVERVVIL